MGVMELKLQNIIVNELSEADYQRLCSAYIYRSMNYTNIVNYGAVAARNRTKKGTPDAYFIDENNSYAYAEYTLQQNDIDNKISRDIEKCLANENIAEVDCIIYCHISTNLSAKTISELTGKCKEKGIKLIIIGIDKLVNDIINEYPDLALDYLGLDETFLERRVLSSSKFCCRGYGTRFGKCKNYVSDSSKYLCKECSAEEYIENIVNILRLQHYELERKDNIFITRLSYGYFRSVILVLPLYSSTINFSTEGLNEGINILMNIKDKYPNCERYIFTNGIVTPDQCQAAKEYDIKLNNDNVLIESLMDFKPYLKDLIEKFNQDPIAKHYIELHSEEGPANDNQKDKKVLLYTKTNEFLHDRSRNGMLILGDYGCGKTSFLYWFSKILSELYLSDNSNYIPIYIPLRNYTKAIDLDNLLLRLLESDCHIPNPSIPLFKYLLRHKPFVFLFDGFDEIAKRVDLDVKSKTFNEICRYALGNTKIIITCRPNFFQETKEYKELLSKSHIKYEPGTGAEIDFTEIHIAPLEYDQIINYIKSYSTEFSKKDISCDRIIKSIRDTHDLMDLSRRPFLLRIIVETLPTFLTTLNKTSKINAAELYRKYTDLWIDREDQKGKTLIKKNDKLAFCIELAKKMYESNAMEIHFTELSKELKLYFPDIKDINELDYFSHDIRSCSFMSSDGSGNFCFIHRSFMEYFVAVEIATKLTKEEDINSLNKPALSTEILLFIKDLLDNGQIREKRIVQLLENAAKSELDSIHGNAIAILSKMQNSNLSFLLNEKLLSGIDFSHSKIHDMVLEEKDLIGTTFYASTITNVTFRKCSLRQVSFEKCTLENVIFDNQLVDNSNFSYATLQRCSFDNTSLVDSNFRGAFIKNCIFNYTDMSGADTSTTKFESNIAIDVTGEPYEMQ